VRSHDLNVRKVGPNQFELPGLDPNFLQVNALETAGGSIYHGFTSSLRKRFSQSFSVNAAYTLA